MNTKNNGDHAAAVAAFIESMGRHLEEDGLPRIAGRLMGALLINPNPCSLDDLTEQLSVSKASISSNARLLEVAGVAEKVTIPGDRRDFYQIAPNSTVRVIEHQLARTQALKERLEAGLELGSAPHVRERFERSIQFTERTSRALRTELQRLNS